MRKQTQLANKSTAEKEMKVTTKLLFGLVTLSAFCALIFSYYESGRVELAQLVEKLELLPARVSRSQLISSLGLSDKESSMTGMKIVNGQFKPENLSLPMTEKWSLPREHMLVVNYGIKLPNGGPFLISVQLINSQEEIIFIR